MATSAGVHLGVLAALLAVATSHRAPPATSPLRVSLVARAPGETTARESAAGQGGTRSAPPRPVRARSTGRPSPRSTPAAEVQTSAAPRPTAAVPGDSPAVVTGLTPVQQDLWVLGAVPRAAAAAPSGPEPSAPAVGSGGAGAAGEGTGADGSSGGPRSSGTASLLETLQRRLAWSAARCAPASAVRLARHGVPGVPLHFCLDGSGTPSGVGLLGSTGSDLLDRAARDCVVPGALPLPPAQGCYTVEVRFPVGG
ncbi:MAG TPA: hypothetical protein VLQ79_03030 [Myxococcaceae bacterium]|nr:hypothetical protein [Myxococcaceae bacterium]